MTANEAAIRAAITKLAEVFGPWSQRRAEVYWLALSDLWPEEVEAGIVQTLRDWKSKDAPPPGFVRERAMAQRSGKPPRSEGARRGPVPWYEARTPLSVGEDGYMRDADGRYVLARAMRLPPRDDGKTAEPWVAFMWMARTVVKLKASAKPEHLPFVELARAGASDSDFRSLWEVRRHAMDEGAMTPEELNVYLLKVVADAMREVQTA